MLIVHVHVQVKPEYFDQFRDATIANAGQSIREPGVVRFDVAQQNDDPSRFILVEIYRDETAAAAHKQTPHYATWRDKVEPMMAAPRSSVKLTDIFPDNHDWR